MDGIFDETRTLSTSHQSCRISCGRLNSAPSVVAGVVDELVAQGGVEAGKTEHGARQQNVTRSDA